MQRPLEGVWPYLRLDATCVRGRRNSRVFSVAVIIAYAASLDGRREGIGESEAKACWLAFQGSLKGRGLYRLAISDHIAA